MSFFGQKITYGLNQIVSHFLMGLAQLYQKYCVSFIHDGNEVTYIWLELLTKK